MNSSRFTLNLFFYIIWLVSLYFWPRFNFYSYFWHLHFYTIIFIMWCGIYTIDFVIQFCDHEM